MTGNTDWLSSMDAPRMYMIFTGCETDYTIHGWSKDGQGIYVLNGYSDRGVVGWLPSRDSPRMDSYRTTVIHGTMIP